MPKYIRTKDGVYESTGKPNAISITNNVLHYCWDENGENEIIIKDDEILNQSDTIEELCDEFVIIRKEENLHTTLRNYSLEYLHILKDRQEHNCEVYGAIWTDKGLIYVAKMNEDGELVLL